MATRESVLLLGRGPLVLDVARTLAADASGRRITVVTAAHEAASHRDFADGRAFDPLAPDASRRLGDALAACEPSVVMLAAFSESAATPRLPWEWDEALAAAVVAALQRHVERGARTPSVLLLSSTAVYGTAAGSPLVFDEQSRLPREEKPSTAAARWAEGLREVERRIVRWAVESGAGVGVLRAASVLGGPMDSPLGSLLAAPLPVRVAGYDPPCQVLHYDDLVRGLALAVANGCGEVLNLVGRDVVPLSRLLAAAGTFAVPLPGSVAGRLAPTALDLDRLCWRTLADGRRATAVLGFRPERTLEDCLDASH